MMTSRVRQLATVAVAAVITLMASAPARADDTELFVGPAVTASPSRPNILFVMDTSGSMVNPVQSQVPYSATTTFSGSCDADRVYWSRPDGQGRFTPPACNTTQYVSASRFTCKAAQPNLTASGIAYVPLAAQWRSNNPLRYTWQNLNVSDNSNYIECAADAGLHGVSDSSTRKFAANGSTNGPWSGNSANKISWSTGEPITFYSGNYLNWRASPYVTLTRLQIMQNTLSTLLDNLEDNVNVGLMRYSNDRNTLPNASDGGMVVRPWAGSKTTGPR